MSETSPSSCNAEQPLGEATSVAARNAPEAATLIRPPPTRFNPAACEDWALTPESVRTEVLRLEAELVAGLKKHQAAAARDAGLADFHAMAARGGTTLRDAVSSYVSLERLLRADPIKGLQAICQNVGLSLRDVADLLQASSPPQCEEEATVQMVAKFATNHPRFDELAEDIVFFIESGRADCLAEAYELAERFYA